MRQHHDTLQQSLVSLAGEGFAHIYRFSSPDELNTAVIERR